jgi:L-alanine-DL-glutamate epimerase-like enolase superfamily enzyme
MINLTVARESWPIRGTFTISRGSKTASDVVVAQIEKEGAVGRGECVPYPRYGETVDSVATQIESLKDRIGAGLTRQDLQTALPAGAARNAIDCALWDLEAKLSGTRVWQLAGLPPPGPVTTAYTLSLGSPEQMAGQAKAASGRALLKLKLGGEGDLARVAAVRTAAPDARLIADANEAWSLQHFQSFGPELVRLGVELVEQPLPDKQDDALNTIDFPIPLCADESCHDTGSLGNVEGRYQFVNVKLDKTGGLTEALRLIEISRITGLDIMIGCMVATSLAMAPAALLGPLATYIDLDGPLLLAKDRDNPLEYKGSTVAPPSPDLWG